MSVSSSAIPLFRECYSRWLFKCFGLVFVEAVSETLFNMPSFDMLMKYYYFLIFSLILSACAPVSQKTSDGLYCNHNSDCPSGVCNPLKADYGTCAIEPCVSGERTRTNDFFCNAHGQWQPSKQAGESCTTDSECYKPTCFMNPSCELTDIPYTTVSCRNGSCTSEIVSDCPPGFKRILEKDQYWTNGTSCFESMAQMVLPTVCAPCGNGVCDNTTESACNCPRDCD